MLDPYASPGVQMTIDYMRVNQSSLIKVNFNAMRAFQRYCTLYEQLPVIEDSAADTPLNHLADRLIEAHEQAVADGDQKLVELIEGALLHVGRRLAAESRKAVIPKPV